MKIQLVSKTPATVFAIGVAEALKEMGHDVLRSSRLNKKRTCIKIDQPIEPYNKSEQFKRYFQRKVQTVPFTIKKSEALSWLITGYSVVCRTKTMGHSGDGIVIAETADELIDAPLYTQYTKKKTEFRVHVFKNKVIFIQQKKQKADAEEVNFKVRNHQFGWVFAHNDLKIKDKAQLESVALSAVKALGYLYGAVDIIYNEKKNKYFVLECNSRPGIEGETAKRYAEEFLENLNSSQGPKTLVSRFVEETGLEFKEEMSNLAYADFIDWLCCTYEKTEDKIPPALYNQKTNTIVIVNYNEYLEMLA